VNIKLLTQISPENRLLNRLNHETMNAQKAFIAVSFIQNAGLKHLFKSIKGMLINKKTVVLYTAGYLGITDPVALERLLQMSQEFFSLKVYFNPADRFHSKFLLFEKPQKKYCLFLGSSNVSVGGLIDVGELNIQLKGKITDQVYKDLQIVINNLVKNKDFKRIDKTLITNYKQMYKKRKTTKKRKFSGMKLPTIPTEKMAIYVADDSFSEKEEKAIQTKHPGWDDYIEMLSVIKALEKGDYFLNVSMVKGEKKSFNVSKFLEYDRIRSVGTVAHIKSGKDISISKLLKKLNVTEKTLRGSKKLDIYDIAILRKNFKDAFA
jgi:HKD family nuclease